MEILQLVTTVVKQTLGSQFFKSLSYKKGVCQTAGQNEVVGVFQKGGRFYIVNIFYVVAGAMNTYVMNM